MNEWWLAPRSPLTQCHGLPSPAPARCAPGDVEGGLSSSYDGEYDAVRDAVPLTAEPRPRRHESPPRPSLHQLLSGSTGHYVLEICRKQIAGGNGANDNVAYLSDRVGRLATLALRGERTSDIVDWLMALPLSDIRRTSVIADACRRIGECWVCDDIDFLEVTTAVGRLQAAFRAIAQAAAPAVPRRDCGSVLVAAAPGEEHVFGLMMLEELFRAAGWSSVVCAPCEHEEFAARLARGRFDAVCLSWSTDRLRDAVGLAVAASLDSVPTVILGGQAALRNLEWLNGQGVEHVCDNPYAALDFCRSSLFKRLDSVHAEQERALAP